MRDPVAAGQSILLRHPHAPAVHPPSAGPHQERSLLADQPDSQAAALHGKTRACQQVQRPGVPTRSPSSPSATRSVSGSVPASPVTLRLLPIGTTESAPRRAWSQGMNQACAKQIAATGA